MSLLQNEFLYTMYWRSWLSCMYESNTRVPEENPKAFILK